MKPILKCITMTKKRAKSLYCYHCKSYIAPLQERSLVMKAVKPKYHIDRMEIIGRCCMKCVEAGCKNTYEIGEILWFRV